MHRQSICATLTYSPESLPEFGSLVRKHQSAFIKALRQAVARRGGAPFSFDCCGEYSPLPLMRPHYHLALFGYEPLDGEPWAKSGAGNQEFVSAELTKAWSRGMVTYQPWSYGAAQYCAGHQAWKLTGDLAHARLAVIGPDGQAVAHRAPEFHQPSTRPGIGRRFFERYGEQALALGFTVASDKPVPVPKYYLRRGDIDMPELAATAREARRLQAVKAASALAPGRLDAIEVCAEPRIKRGGRGKGFV